METRPSSGSFLPPPQLPALEAEPGLLLPEAVRVVVMLAEGSGSASPGCCCCCSLVVLEEEEAEEEGEGEVAFISRVCCSVARLAQFCCVASRWLLLLMK